MRSSKSRSRNKSNRNNRSVGNIVNRVFDSSGPEGKVRGTPQQIIEKYNQLARDAQLGNDRVAAENFQQHAEHYLRMLGEAQKEQDQRREQQEQENRQRQADRDRERAQRQERESGGQSDDQPQHSEAEAARDDSGRQEQPRQDAPRQDAPQKADALDVVETSEPSGDEESGLVETPENKPQAKPKRTYNRKPRKPKGDGNSTPDEGAPAAAE
ncbi:nucleoside triphosphate hydrolase [Oceanicola sp. 22II-s10i]|uniref:DUF4167 domain-containing protein n=1 Tax=Oceanicola sp. 22II-s10i TaxID=1317116 RepID=UPI000B523B0E|nr:DUF4167 domain-containing protein [Oceanicola sp. 22II-s10i]OWU84859.1 nucleoside triphosphate hydrolase [Oceanicola sp. 22II-s10i]